MWDDAEPHRKVSTGGGSFPSWSRHFWPTLNSFPIFTGGSGSEAGDALGSARGEAKCVTRESVGGVAPWEPHKRKCPARSNFRGQKSSQRMPIAFQVSFPD